MPVTTELSPPELSWRGVSPTYVKVRVIRVLISTVIWTGILAAPAVLALVLGWGEGALPWLWILPGIAVVWGGIDMVLVPRRVRAIGYAQGATELWLRKGLFFRSVTVVPYGRMQYVDLTTGPVLSAFKLVSLTLHTASASTDAVLPGLAREDADRLREQLTERGEELMVGL